MRLLPIALAALLATAGAASFSPAARANETVDSVEAPEAGIAPEVAEAPEPGGAPEPSAVPESEAAAELTESFEAEVAPETVATTDALPATPSAAVPEEPVAPEAAVAETPLGPMGYDSEGRPGRVHVVVRGDTLWDVSDAYLGTPWVWPSIWQDNEAIENPHLIFPGDHIWITPTEMRKVTAEEAQELLANQPPPAEEPALPASFSDALADDALEPGRVFRYTSIETVGFVTDEVYQGAATILDSYLPRVWLGDHDRVLIGYGAGEVAAGDEFEIFRPVERVVDPHTGRKVGWATRVLGWLEVNEVHDESATATIRLSRSEVRRGDYLLPRSKPSAEIAIGPKPAVEGRIIHTPDERHTMGHSDVVYLDRGTAQGLAIGSPLEVFREVGSAHDELRRDDRAMPAEVVAKLIVVQAAPDASVAVVTHTRAELERGDSFRGTDSLGW